jgi:hypothetical protein
MAKEDMNEWFRWTAGGPALFIVSHRLEEGRHQVHRAGCGSRPDDGNFDELGEFTSFEEAMVAAVARGITPVDPCDLCRGRRR